MSNANSLGFDDLDMGMGDIPDLPPIKKDEIDRASMKAVQREGGFDRSISTTPSEPIVQDAPKEKVVPLSFRVKESERKAYQALVLEEYGNDYGGRIALFRKMVAFYKEHKT